MKTLRKNGGFTLVELIVVIAILAILAGVAVPAYTGYMTKAKDAAVIAELEALETAVSAAAAMNGKEIGTLTVAEGKTITAKDKASADIDFSDFYNSTTLKADLEGTSYKAGAAWSADDGWTANQKKNQ